MDIERSVLLAAVVVLLALTVAFVVPFLQYFLLAVLLAYFLHPLRVRLEPRLGRRGAALVLLAGAVATVLVPLVLVARAVATDAARLLAAIERGEVDLAAFERAIAEVTGVAVDLEPVRASLLGDDGAATLGNLVGVLGTVTHALLGIGLAAFLLYYFLKDGDRFVRWLRRTAPMSDETQDELYGAIDDVMWAVLAGHVLVALVQGIAAGLGLFATGIPNAAFWTAVMVVLSLLPVVGSFLVWGPAVVYLAAAGRPVAAGLLFVHGTIVVGLSDDYLRPIVIDRRIDLSPAVVVVGVFGGIYVIGFMGIFFGPVVVGALRATVEVAADQYDRDRTGRPRARDAPDPTD